MHERLNLQLDMFLQYYQTIILVVGEERYLVHTGEIEAMLVQKRHLQ